MPMFFLKRQNIRTRFAPSPTGYLHVGGLRTALYAYLFAKKNGGDFILRIEDTDQSREIPGAVENLLKSLYWANLPPDEGILLIDDKITSKGKFGPYQQSKRLKIYQEFAQKLINQDQAYYCFCSAEHLETLRKDQSKADQPTRYDGHCRALSLAEAQTKIQAGEKYVIRMKTPVDEEVIFEDLIRGQVKFKTNDLDDQVIIKSDGFPTYHLAVVVDDYLMRVSHVIRGEEWLPSTPKHLLLYRFFGWSAPCFAHLPLLLNPDKSKLSKRQGDVSVEDYQVQGYLPAALVNFVALLGWNSGDDRELFTLKELIKEFDLKKVHKAGAVFNREKLDWLNAQYLKKLSPADFIKVARSFLIRNLGTLPADLNLDAFFQLEQERISRLSEIGQDLPYFFQSELKYDPALLVWKKSTKETIAKNLNLLLAELEKYDAKTWTKVILEKKIKDFIARQGLNNGETLWPLRVALTGAEKSPTPFEILTILGPEKSLTRIKRAIDLLSVA